MKRRSISIGIGLLAGLGAGIRFVARSQKFAGANAAEAARISFTRESSRPTASPTIGESARIETTRTKARDRAKLIRQAAAASTVSRALPIPPLPSRVEPGRTAESMNLNRTRKARRCRRRRFPRRSCPARFRRPHATRQTASTRATRSR